MRRTLIVALVLAACRTNKDADGDGSLGDDCDPFDAAVHPGATEYCNGRDDDCSGTADDGAVDGWTAYADADGDGYGDDAATTLACTPPPDSATRGGDCDDADADRHPGAAEGDCTDATDWNCDGSTGFTDADADGFAACEDCDDDDDATHPGADETCDGADEDCDGTVDEDARDATEWFADLDGDGSGSDRFTETACEASAGFVADDGDCNDLDSRMAPGNPEACDGLDNDCDGTPDDEVSGLVSYYRDADSDGFGAGDEEVTACAQPVGYVANLDDCDDDDDTVHPGAPETNCKDPVDRNCDGSVGSADGDGDGYAACDDCDDTRKDTNATAAEVCDGVDNDCDAQIDEVAPTWYADVDRDGHAGKAVMIAQCTAPPGFMASADDCDDLDADVYPGATEVCDGRDGDCADGVPATETDADRDGFLACAECDDSDASAYPGASETCDGEDDDCDGTPDDGAIDPRDFYRDGDNDGYGRIDDRQRACTAPSGFVDKAGDCDDGDTAVSPAGTEICNQRDDDCDGRVDDGVATQTWYVDADGDGYGDKNRTTLSCASPGPLYASKAGDCADANATVYPGRALGCDNIDHDCDGKVDNDADGDGYSAYTCGGTDCDDANNKLTPFSGCNARTCRDLRQAGLPNGTYTLDPDGAGTLGPVVVQCEMSLLGGGWTLVGRYYHTAATMDLTGSAVGTPPITTSQTTSGRLSDAYVQAFASGGVGQYLTQSGTSHTRNAACDTIYELQTPATWATGTNYSSLRCSKDGADWGAFFDPTGPSLNTQSGPGNWERNFCRSSGGSNGTTSQWVYNGFTSVQGDDLCANGGGPNNADKWLWVR